MPLHIEQITNDVIATLQANLGGQILNVLNETDSALAIPSPNPEDYFIGEPSRIRAYNFPSCFVIANRTARPNAGTSNDYSAILYQEHSIIIDLVAEATDEQDLTRMCWRYAQAIDSSINELEVVPGAITSYSTKAFVRDIDYGVLFVSRHPDQRTFRKDVSVELLIKHWDQLTPMGSGAMPVAPTQVGIVANVTELQLTTTNPTTVISYTAPNVTGNYEIFLYYRVTVATTLTIVVSWVDGGGAQSTTVINGAQLAGSFTVSPLFIVHAANQTISIIATSSVANAVTVSAAIEYL